MSQLYGLQLLHCMAPGMCMCHLHIAPHFCLPATGIGSACPPSRHAACPPACLPAECGSEQCYMDPEMEEAMVLR